MKELEKTLRVKICIWRSRPKSPHTVITVVTMTGCGSAIVDKAERVDVNDSFKIGYPLDLQSLSRAVNDRTSWRSLVPRVVISALMAHDNNMVKTFVFPF